MRPARFLDALDRLVGALLRAAQWLILPVVILLFLQWPLRDLVRSHSREANDLGQWLFALYVAASVTAATRARTHLAADMLARRYRPAIRALIVRCGALIGLMPWALLVLIAGKGMVVSSVMQLEGFPDTNNPGYFLIKVALWLMAALVLAQAALDLARPRPGIGA